MGAHSRRVGSSRGVRDAVGGGVVGSISTMWAEENRKKKKKVGKKVKRGGPGWGGWVVRCY